jgi:hypothetical protein
MRKERKEIGLGFLHRNEGQLVWLPKNPRQWTQTDIDRTAESIKRDTDFLEDRPLLVVALDKRDYIVFAGNLRYTGAVAAKLSKAPAVVYTPEGEEDEETIRRRALLDNGSFGSWDWDEVFSGPFGQMDLEALGIGKAFQEAGAFGNEEELDTTELEADTMNSAGESDTGYAAITFLFPLEEVGAVRAYMEEHGKETLVQKIIELCQSVEAK